MNEKKDENRQVAGAVILLILATVLISPLALYIHQFGYVLSTDHQKWAEFGSALSGIYSPIIAFLALLILVAQFNSQKALSKHQFDQTFIESTRKEINYFIEKLDSNLQNNHKSGITLREFLENKFAYLDKEQLNQASVKALAQGLRNEHKIVLDMWLAIYPLLQGLGKNNFFPYKHNFTGAILRISCTLTIETCVAIDNYCYTVTNDLYKGNYHFSKKIQI